MKLHNWVMANWKPAAALIYTFICLCDFVIFPAYVGLNHPDAVALVHAIRGLDPQTQQQVLQLALSSYQPLTLKGAGMFHLAFGALLTGAAITGNVSTGLYYTPLGAQFKRRSNDKVTATDVSAEATPTKKT